MRFVPYSVRIAAHEKADRAKRTFQCVLAVFAFCLCILFSGIGISCLSADAAELSLGSGVHYFSDSAGENVVVGSFSSPFGNGSIEMDYYFSTGYFTIYFYPLGDYEGTLEDYFTAEQFYQLNPQFTFYGYVFYTVGADPFRDYMPFTVSYSELVDYLPGYYRLTLRVSEDSSNNQYVLHFEPNRDVTSGLIYSGTPDEVLAEYGRSGYVEYLAQCLYNMSSNSTQFTTAMSRSSVSDMRFDFFVEYNTPDVIVSNKNTDKIIANADKNTQLITDFLEDLQQNQQDNFDKVYEEQLKGNELLGDISTELEHIYNEGKGNFDPIFDDAYENKVNQGSNDLADIESVEKPDFENIIDFDEILSFFTFNSGFNFVMDILRLVLSHFFISTIIVFAFSFGIIRYVLFGKR